MSDIAKDGRLVTEQTIKEYQAQLNYALERMVAEAEQEYNTKEFVTLADLKREEGNV